MTVGILARDQGEEVAIPHSAQAVPPVLVPSFPPPSPALVLVSPGRAEPRRQRQPSATTAHAQQQHHASPRHPPETQGGWSDSGQEATSRSGQRQVTQSL